MVLQTAPPLMVRSIVLVVLVAQLVHLPLHVEHLLLVGDLQAVHVFALPLHLVLVVLLQLLQLALRQVLAGGTALLLVRFRILRVPPLESLLLECALQVEQLLLQLVVLEEELATVFDLLVQLTLQVLAVCLR